MLKRLLSQIRTRFPLAKKLLSLVRLYFPISRADGLDDEREFWRYWFMTKGARSQEEYKMRLDPTLPLQDHIRRHIDSLQSDEIQILDVGAGPLTTLGKRHPTKALAIVAIDVLARQYDALLAEFGIEPIVRTMYGDAEKLVETFGQNRFDFVHAMNCVDHMIDPLAAIEQMLLVVKGGRIVYLSHVANEASSQSYGGLHQWNLKCRHDDLIIESARTGESSVRQALGHLAEFECNLQGIWITVLARKRTP
jgi:SAM-dependent methyltransferase